MRLHVAKHTSFTQSKYAQTAPGAPKGPEIGHCPTITSQRHVRLLLRTASVPWNPTMSFLTATKITSATGAVITAAAGNSLALQLLFTRMLTTYPFQSTVRVCRALLFIVTTSLYKKWVICVPAAPHRASSCFSGCFSGIEPWSPVTRYNHAIWLDHIDASGW